MSVDKNFTLHTVTKNGTKIWHLNGLLHREDGPAVVFADGGKRWFLNGKRHCEDGPAFEDPDGTKQWYLNDKQYSESDWRIAVGELKKPKPQVLELKYGEKLPVSYTGIAEFDNGDKVWYLNGYLHREDGPAIEWANGDKEWFLNGKLHREDGPAYEGADGTKDWFLNGREYAESEWKVAVEKLKKQEPQVLELKEGEFRPENYTGIAKWPNGTKAWYLNGDSHREDGPAFEMANGYKGWWLNGDEYTESEWKVAVEKLNKERGKVSMKKETNKKPELPVLELKTTDSYPLKYTGIIKWSDGEKWWVLNGKYHREDGPAKEQPDGSSKEWWLNGHEYTESEWKVAVEKLNKEKTKVRDDEGMEEDSANTHLSQFRESVTIPIINILTPKKGQLPSEYWEQVYDATIDTTTFHYRNSSDSRRGSSFEIDGESYIDVTRVDICYASEEIRMCYRQLSDGTFHHETLPAIVRFYCFSDGKVDYTVEDYYYYGKQNVPEDEATREAVKKWYHSFNDIVAAPKQKQLAPTTAQVVASPVPMVPVQTGFKSELKRAGVRVACRKSVKVAQDTLVSLFAAGKSKEETKRIRDGIASILSTELGKAGIGYVLGAVLPQVKEQFPEKYQAILTEFGSELRIEAMAVAGEEAIDVAMPILGMAKTGLMSAIEGLVTSEEVVPTRVELPEQKKPRAKNKVEELIVETVAAEEKKKSSRA